jgi:hypothetical protein
LCERKFFHVGFSFFIPLNRKVAHEKPLPDSVKVNKKIKTFTIR